MTRARRVMVVVLACVVSLVLVPAPASACSCGGLGPAEMLESHDAAFIGKVISRRGGLLGLDATWTFQVTHEVKGNFDATVKIASPSSGAACGFELEPGQEAAVFVRVEGSRLHSGLCSTLDADALRAHLKPQPAAGGRATLLVAAGGTGRHLWLFDDRGRLANASRDGRGDYLQDVSICPGGRTLVELWHGKVVVRDLRTLKAARSQRVPRDVGRIWCRDGAGDRLLGARRNNRTGDYDSIVPLQTPDRPVVEGAWVDIEVVGDDAIATVGRDFTQMHRISLADGRETMIHAARNKPGVAVHVAAGIEGFAVSPDGTRVAFEVTIYPDQGRPSSDVFVYEVATGRRKAMRHIAGEGMEVRWLDNASLLFTTYDEDDSAAQVLDAASLRKQTMLPGEAHWPRTTGPGATFLGMDGPRLTSVDATTGKIRTLATIPAEYSGTMLRLPHPVEVRASKDQRAAEQPAAAAGAPSAPGPDLGGGASAFPVVPVATAAALMLVGAAVLLLRRRQGR